MEKKTVREDILDYLESHYGATNPLDIAKNKHRHIASIRRELRRLEKDNLIDITFDDKTKHYTSIKLKREYTIDFEKGEIVFTPERKTNWYDGIINSIKGYFK